MGAPSTGFSSDERWSEWKGLLSDGRQSLSQSNKLIHAELEERKETNKQTHHQNPLDCRKEFTD